jgi:hypothetical protein
MVLELAHERVGKIRGEGNVHRCGECGWAGVLSKRRGTVVMQCPSCEIAPETDGLPPMPAKQSRNSPCACGSGLKAKKCCL